MRYAATSLVLVALISSTTFAAPPRPREPGFIARHHRRHFRSRTVNSTVRDTVSDSIQDAPSTQPDSINPSTLVNTSALAYEKPHGAVTAACSALLDLYLWMGGPEWRNQDGWSMAISKRPEHMNCCEWFGVTCSPDGTKVIALELSNNLVRGPFSDAIYSLPDLQTLNLSSNPLHSELPQLPMSFHVIDISHASLYGSPSPSLFRSSAISIIHLKNNSLDGTVDISGAKNLDTLVLDANFFTGIIMGPSEGKKWKRLVFRNNMFGGPLPDLSGAKDLEIVEFGNNVFTGGLFDPSPLTKLVNFDLRVNQLSGPFPDLTLFKSPVLKLLGLAGNSFTGPVDLQNSDQTLAEAPLTLQTCSIVVQAPNMELPCNTLPLSGASSTWAGKCEVIRACRKVTQTRLPHSS